MCNVATSKLGFTGPVFYLCFLLAFVVIVSGDGGTRPADTQTSIVHSNDKTAGNLLRSSLLETAGLRPTFDTTINDLLDSNFHNGTLTLDFSIGSYGEDDPSATQLLDYFLSPNGEQIRDTVLEIIIPWFPGDMIEDIDGLSGFNESQLLDFLAKVNNLEILRWQDGPIPENLVVAIEQNHPNSCLHLENGYLGTALAHPSLVCSIKAYALSFCTSPSVWPSISKALAMSSSIHSLTVESGTCGCVLLSTRQALDIYSSTRFPALEELRLIGYNAYDFDGPAGETSELSRWKSGWGQIKLDLLRVLWKLQSRISGSRQKTNLEAWHEAMDWTKLRVLELNRLSVNNLNSFNWPMPSLRSFRSDLPLWWNIRSPEDRDTYNEAMSAFVSRIPSRLESLGFRSFYHPFSLQRIADTHGQSLKNLELRGGSNVGCQSYLDETALEQVREQFPSLEHLEVDLYRNGTWPNSTLDTLSSFPRLTHLALWLELGGDAYTLPLLTNSSASSLFHSLRTHKNGTELTRATFYLGAYDRYPSRGMTGRSWSTGRSAKVECSAERGAAPGDGDCRFHGYDPSRPETANWQIRSTDEYTSIFSLDEMET